MKNFNTIQSVLFAGLVMNCSTPQKAGVPFIRIANNSTVVLIYKVADRSGHPEEPCCSGKSYSLVSYIRNDIILHLVFSQASPIKEITYKTKQKTVVLPKATMFYKMPNSPLSTCVGIRPGDLGVLTAFDSSRTPCITIDCKALFNEIRALKSVVDPSMKSVYYDKLPGEMFVEQSNDGEPRR
jgi:hypothetical protein